jgi:hypothetical protein
VKSPRIFGIPAVEAPIVAVIRRGPSDWVHVGRWNTEEDKYEPGAWLQGVIYPQKCDLSFDGRWFAYSAMKVGSDWPAGDIYEAISRLPWLTALAAWNSGSTYTRGLHFVADPAESNVGEPDVGDAGPPTTRYGLRWTRPEQFAVERRRGWQESAETLPRDAGGHWDEHRRVEMFKLHGAFALHVEGRYAAFRAGAPDDGPPVYWVTRRDEIEVLEGVHWADWDVRGRLLMATTAGQLLAGLPGDTPVEIADLSGLEPGPRPAPHWAGEW